MWVCTSLSKTKLVIWVYKFNYMSIPCMSCTIKLIISPYSKCSIAQGSTEHSWKNSLTKINICSLRVEVYVMHNGIKKFTLVQIDHANSILLISVPGAPARTDSKLFWQRFPLHKPSWLFWYICKLIVWWCISVSSQTSQLGWINLCLYKTPNNPFLTKEGHCSDSGRF